METNDYRISFFKPTTVHARINRNLTIVLVVIWAVAVFGFQGLLKIIEKPTPEPILNEFNMVWNDVKHEKAEKETMQHFGNVLLKVMNKPFIKPADELVLKDIFGSVVIGLAPDTMQQKLVKKVKSFQQLEETITSLSNEAYTKLKKEIKNEVSYLLNIKEGQFVGQYIAFRFDKTPAEVSQNSMDALPGIMELYLTHNRSFLTDAIFMGFPFHYFYTAVLLLIIFVFLCWLYCKRTDSTHLKHEVIEKHD
jgi:uncharacterized membrane protein YhdT